MEPKTNLKPVAKNFNKPAYIIFILLGIFFLVKKDFSQAVIYGGLALAFDPFDTAIPFPKRPFYQQALLLIHLSVTLALIVLTLMGK